MQLIFHTNTPGSPVAEFKEIEIGLDLLDHFREELAHATGGTATKYAQVSFPLTIPLTIYKEFIIEIPEAHARRLYHADGTLVFAKQSRVWVVVGVNSLAAYGTLSPVVESGTVGFALTMDTERLLVDWAIAGSPLTWNPRHTERKAA
jgi:hypothetical protein